MKPRPCDEVFLFLKNIEINLVVPNIRFIFTSLNNKTLGL